MQLAVCAAGGLRSLRDWRLADCGLRLAVWAVGGLGGWRFGRLAVWAVGGLGGWRFGRLAVWAVGGLRGWQLIVADFPVCVWRFAFGGLRLAVCVWRFAFDGLRLAVCVWRFAFGGLRLRFAFGGLRLAVSVWWFAFAGLRLAGCVWRFAFGGLRPYLSLIDILSISYRYFIDILSISYRHIIDTFPCRFHALWISMPFCLFINIDNLDTLIDIQNIPQLNNASISQQPSVQSCFSRPLQ